MDYVSVLYGQGCTKEFHGVKNAHQHKFLITYDDVSKANARGFSDFLGGIHVALYPRYARTRAVGALFCEPEFLFLLSVGK